jgi:hypothetical protein
MPGYHRKVPSGQQTPHNVHETDSTSRCYAPIDDEYEDEKNRETANPKGFLAAICFGEAEIMRPTRQGSALGSE